MRQYSDIVLFHAVGRADLGLGTEEEFAQLETEFCELLRGQDPDTVSSILRLTRREQTAGDRAPLQSVLATLAKRGDLDGARVRLVLVSTLHVAHFAEAIKESLLIVPDLYGQSFEEIRIARSASLEEQDFTSAVRQTLSDVDTTSAQALVVWGSGSTQAILNVLDAVIDRGVPWSLVMIQSGQDGRHEIFDPTGDLPIDPLVPLLRRWRYHELLLDLIRERHVRVTDSQRSIIEAEAKTWGGAYAQPTATNTLALLASALMRGDGTSGFAASVHICQRYYELRRAEQDLISWAGDKLRRRNSKPVTFGPILGAIQRYRGAAPAVRESLRTPGGLWLASPAADALYAMSTNSRHELLPPSPGEVRHLRDYLTSREQAANVDAGSAAPAAAGMNELTLVPARTVWYVSIAGCSAPAESIPVRIARANSGDRERRRGLDPQVRAYLGVRDGDPMDMATLVLGTRSQTDDHAVEIANLVTKLGQRATVDILPSLPDEATPSPTVFTSEDALCLLERHLDSDVGAVVLVPTGSKVLVLPLLKAAQRLAAQRGVPLFLRQLVNRNQDVLSAGTHRLPLRFGADLGILSAARYAMEVAEFDTAARLLGAINVGVHLSDRAGAFSRVLRCQVARDGAAQSWPAEFAEGVNGGAGTLGLIADRLEVWATLPGLGTDAAIDTRAIVGACASLESSIPQKDRSFMDRLKGGQMNDLFAVRNKLPAMHGTALPADQRVDDLVSRYTRTGRYTTVASLLAGMAQLARGRFEAKRPQGWPSLVSIRDGLRAQLSELVRAEQTRHGATRPPR